MRSPRAAEALAVHLRVPLPHPAHPALRHLPLAHPALLVEQAGAAAEAAGDKARPEPRACHPPAAEWVAAPRRLRLRAC